MSAFELFRSGSSKDVYVWKNEQGVIENIGLLFSDRVSVFDRGPIPVEFTGLGQLRFSIAKKVFEAMQRAGFATHFIGSSKNQLMIYAYPFDIQEIDVNFGEASIGRVLPVEILFRHVVTPKLLDRIEAKTVDQEIVEALLVGERGLEVGTRFSPPFVECSTKFEPADRYLRNDEAAQIADLSLTQLQSLFENEVLPIVAFLKQFFKQAGFDPLDGKIEGAVTYKDGKFFLIDSVSPDELRLIGPDGKSKDKDPVRQWYEKHDPGWVARLKAAKDQYPGQPDKWPPYEKVPPQSLIDLVVANYTEVDNAL